jgi:hypothetical protein
MLAVAAAPTPGGGMLLGEPATLVTAPTLPTVDAFWVPYRF